MLQDLHRFFPRNQLRKRHDASESAYFHHRGEQLHRRWLALACCRFLHDGFSYSCNSFSFRRLFQKLRQRQVLHLVPDVLDQILQGVVHHRHLVRHLDVHLVCDKEIVMMALHQIFRQDVDHHLVVDRHLVSVMVALQNLDELILVADLTFLVFHHPVFHRPVFHLVVALVVGVGHRQY